jgi:hypothetical protein
MPQQYAGQMLDGAVTFSIDYNQQNRRVQQLWATNNDPEHTVYVGVISPTGEVFGTLLNPGDDIKQNVPGSWNWTIDEIGWTGAYVPGGDVTAP